MTEGATQTSLYTMAPRVQYFTTQNHFTQLGINFAQNIYLSGRYFTFLIMGSQKSKETKEIKKNKHVRPDLVVIN